MAAARQSWIERFSENLPESVIARDNRAAIARVAAALPPTSGGGFEYHLGAPEARFDCLVRVTDRDGARGILAAHRDPSLRAIARFCRVWGTPGSILNRAVDNVWLEFDMDRDAIAAGGPPCVFFDVDRYDRLDIAENLACMQTGLETLGQRGDRVAQLAPLVRHAPHGVGVHYLGVMLGRRTTALRVCLKNLTARTALPYLDAVGWRGDRAGVDHVLSTFGRHVDRIVLALDVDRGVNARIGVELSFATGHPARWRGLLTRLRRHRLCSVRDKEIVLSCRESQINHIKLTCGSDAPITAKAYLYVPA